ncbi:MAG: AraC family transcriptional regulator [Bacteroidota bacterium]
MNKVKSYNRLSELYDNEAVGNTITQDSDFTIHKLETVHDKAVESPVFRANYYSFVLIRQGETAYTIDGIEFLTKPNTLYFTNPGHLKSFRLPAGTQGILVTVSEDYLKQHIHKAVFEEFGFLLTEIVPPCYLNPERADELYSLCLQILEEHQKPSLLKDKIITSLFTVFLLKVKEFLLKDDSFKVEYNRDSLIVKRFKEDLEANFRALAKKETSKLLRVQDFAEKQHLHPNYLSTVIKTKTGKSAQAIIQDKMLIEAKALLSNSELTIKEVAYSLGFSEPTYFSKFFKKHVNKTPAQYRKA